MVWFSHLKILQNLLVQNRTQGLENQLARRMNTRLNCSTSWTSKIFFLEAWLYSSCHMRVLLFVVAVVKANSQSRVIEIVHFNAFAVNGIVDSLIFSLPYQKKRVYNSGKPNTCIGKICMYMNPHMHTYTQIHTYHTHGCMCTHI